MLATQPQAHPLSMATAPMAPGRCWPACTPPASTHGSRSKPRSPKGHFTKDQFQIDLVAGAVTCPARRTVPILYSADPDNRHHGQARFGLACTACPLRGQCTSAAAGRTVTITAYEHELAAARICQADPVRAADYRATRPKVERKLAHLVRRRHGGRRVRVRGLVKVAADFSLLAAAVNLARLGVLGLHWSPSDGWAATRLSAIETTGTRATPLPAPPVPIPPPRPRSATCRRQVDAPHPDLNSPFHPSHLGRVPKQLRRRGCRRGAAMLRPVHAHPGCSNA